MILLAAAWAAMAPDRLRAVRRTLVWRWSDWRVMAGRGAVSGEIARTVALDQRRMHFRSHIGNGAPFGAMHRTQTILHPHLVVARERYDRVAAQLAIEPRDPFLDIRLVAFCLSLPPSQLQDQGWPKIILRRAMRDLLPIEISWRRGKEHLGWSFTQSVMKNWPIDRSGESPGDRKLDRFLPQPGSTRASFNQLRDMDKERQVELRILACWLDRNQM